MHLQAVTPWWRQRPLAAVHPAMIMRQGSTFTLWSRQQHASCCSPYWQQYVQKEKDLKHGGNPCAWWSPMCLVVKLACIVSAGSNTFVAPAPIGSSAAGCGAFTSPCSTIQAGINATADNGTVHVMPGRSIVHCSAHPCLSWKA